MGNLSENIDKLELMKEIETLRKENEELRYILNSKISRNSLSAYEIVAKMVANKVYDEVREDVGCNVRTSLKRKLMDDLKWDLRVRKATNFTQEHIPQVEDYLKKYTFDRQYVKSTAIPILGEIS